ncbi:MAG: hypothetical protein WCO79_02530 [bacterium]
MKTGFFHPNPDRPLQQSYHVVRLSRSAPLQQRLRRTAINLFEEWRAAMSSKACDRLYRVGQALLVLALSLAIVAIIWWYDQEVDITGRHTLTVHRSVRTGQIVKIVDHRNREIRMTSEEVAKLKHVERIPVW